MDPSGLIRVDNVRARRAAAPGHLGRRRLSARTARSTCASPASAATYGPLAVLVTGTRDARRRSALDAASPGFGIGLRDVNATVRATAGGWAIQRHRRIGLRAVQRRRGHPLRSRPADHRGQPADLRRDRLSAAGSSGPRAGPFAGTLTHGRPGPGRHGPARRRRPLPADRHRRHRQRRAHARRRADPHPARHRPGDRRSSIPTRRTIVGDAQLAGLTQRRPRSSSARGSEIDYRGGNGHGPALRRGAPRRAVPRRRQCRAGARPDPRRDAGPGQQHPASASPSPPRSAATAAAGGWRR